MTRGRGIVGGAMALLVAAVVSAATACGGSDPVDLGDPDPAIAPLVGSWRASEMVLTNKANPDVAPDLVQEGAQFDLNVQPSGQYTAILTYMLQASTEIGVISVSGNTVIMERSFPSPQTSSATYQISGNQLTLDGDSEFDFNLDGTPEPAQAHIVLQKR